MVNPKGTKDIVTNRMAEEMCRLKQAGWRLRQIAARFDVASDTVSRYTKHLPPVKARCPRKHDWAEVLLWSKLGLNPMQISVELGIPNQTVYCIFQKATQDDWDEAHRRLKQWVVDAYCDGEPPSSIREWAKIHVQTVRQWAREAGRMPDRRTQGRWQTFDHARALRAMDLGATDAQLAERFGVSERTIEGLRRKKWRQGRERVHGRLGLEAPAQEVA